MKFILEGYDKDARDTDMVVEVHAEDDFKDDPPILFVKFGFTCSRSELEHLIESSKAL